MAARAESFFSRCCLPLSKYRTSLGPRAHAASPRAAIITISQADACLFFFITDVIAFRREVSDRSTARQYAREENVGIFHSNRDLNTAGYASSGASADTAVPWVGRLHKRCKKMSQKPKIRMLRQ